MKVLLPISFLIIITFSDCDKQASPCNDCENEVCEDQNLPDQLIGNWRIVRISGGFSGSQEIQNFNIMSLSQIHSYTISYNDEVIQGGTYNIQRLNTNIYNSPLAKCAINFQENFNYDQSANFYSHFSMAIELYANDSLVLSQTLADGFNYHFVKID